MFDGSLTHPPPPWRFTLMRCAREKRLMYLQEEVISLAPSFFKTSIYQQEDEGSVRSTL